MGGLNGRGASLRALPFLFLLLRGTDDPPGTLRADFDEDKILAICFCTAYALLAPRLLAIVLRKRFMVVPNSDVAVDQSIFEYIISRVHIFYVCITMSVPAASMTIVIRITKEGYADEPGHIPKQFKQHIESFKTKKAYSRWRCPRGMFVPFTTQGTLKRDPDNPNPGDQRVDGLLVPSGRFPIYLFLHFRHGRLVATAVVQKRSSTMVKLVYLCAAPAAKGAGKALMTEVAKQVHYAPNRPIYAKLDDNSGINHYYSKAGWTRLKKFVQLGTKEAPKKVPAYKKTLMEASMPAQMQSYSGLSYEDVQPTTPSLVALASPSKPTPGRMLPRKPRRPFVRSPYQLRHRYALRTRF